MTYFEQMVENYEREGLPELKILDKRIPHQWNTYTGRKRLKTKCITFHNSGIDGVPASGSYNWIKNYSSENKDMVSWAATVDYDGSIWQHGEWDEIFYASGTWPPSQYTDLAISEFDSAPYLYDIPFEASTINYKGQKLYINDIQLMAMAYMGSKLCLLFDTNNPSSGGFRRHFDFAKNKPECPYHLINKKNWSRFLSTADRIYKILEKDYK